MEELRWSLAQAKLHCRLLLVEGNANAVDRDMQECRASRYQEILSEITGEVLHSWALGPHFSSFLD